MVSDIKQYSPLGRSYHSVLVFDYNCYIVMDSNSRMKFSYDKGNLPAMNSDLSLDWTNYFKDCSEMSAFSGACLKPNSYRYKMNMSRIGSQKVGHNG